MNRLGLDMQTVFGLPPVDHVVLAADLGCSHISAGLAPVPWRLADFPDWSLRDDPALRREMKAAMRDRGISLSAMEGFAIRPQSDARDRAADLDLAAELGARRASAVSIERDMVRAYDQLSILAALGAERGILMTLEFAPPHGIATLQGAVAAIAAIGSPNLRLVLDAMHLFRSGAAIADLAALDPALIGYAQLCDAPLAGDGKPYIDEACFDRQAPGEGELPLAKFLAAVPVDIPVGLETPMRSAIEQQGFSATMRRIVSAGRRLLDESRA